MSSLKVRPGWGGLNIELINTSVVILVVHQDGIAVFYTVRPLELLRLHHERIETWILEQAGIVFDAKAAPCALRVVSG